MGRRRKGEPISGWVIIDKPEGPTSTDIVNTVRRGLNAQKAGHGGTLDPLATGLLAVALGEATKTIAFVMDAPKTYRFTARWGEARSTDDREGEVIESCAARPDQAAIEAALPGFMGRIEQLPPVYSAIKVDGERAYDLARAGETVALQPRPVVIHDLRLLTLPDADTAEFEMTCGKGTYVRSLVRDMAKALGTCGHVDRIRRTATGRFDESHAIGLEQWRDLVHKGGALEHLLPVETALDDIPALAVTGTDATRLRNGQPILLRDSGVLAQVKALSTAAGPDTLAPDNCPDALAGSTAELADLGVQPDPVEPTVLCSLKGKPVALCRYERGELHPTRVFNLPL